MTSATVPRFRAPEFRDLAREAMSQGWDVYQRKGGHVSAVNPQTGARVDLSATAYSGPVVSAKRRDFIRAGLDIDPRTGHRPRHRQEAPMQVHDVTPATPAAVTPLEAREVQSRPNAPQPAGGKYAMRGAQEVLDVGGHRVVIGERQDGVWMAYTRDLGLKARRRTWYSSEGRDALVAHVSQDVADRPPVLEDLVAITPPVEAAAPSNGGTGPGFHVVQADPEEFPLAAALDSLDANLAPALEALAAAGKGDAVALLQAEVVRTPIEEELLALYRRVMRGT
jgi:hypothetical protein